MLPPAGNVGAGGVAEWLRQGPAKPCTRVRFPPPPRGRLAQWKRASLTPRRSLVRTQHRPRKQASPQGVGAPRAGVRVRHVPHAVREDQRICIDHDHACCPPKLPGKCCGGCLHGLLCLTCTVALGYIETYSELATAYLGTALRSASPQQVGRSGLSVLRSGDGDLRERRLDQQVQRQIDTEEVTGSISVSPTSLRRSEANFGDSGPTSRSFVNDLSTGRATVMRHVLNQGGTGGPEFRSAGTLRFEPVSLSLAAGSVPGSQASP
jgi:hypothetical protein